MLRRPGPPRSPFIRVCARVQQARRLDRSRRHYTELSALDRGQLSSPSVPPRHHRTELKGRDHPVSGECPAPIQNQPAFQSVGRPPARHRSWPPWAPETPDPPWPPGSHVPPWRPLQYPAGRPPPLPSRTVTARSVTCLFPFSYCLPLFGLFPVISSLFNYRSVSSPVFD